MKEKTPPHPPKNQTTRKTRINYENKAEYGGGNIGLNLDLWSPFVCLYSCITALHTWEQVCRETSRLALLPWQCATKWCSGGVMSLAEFLQWTQCKRFSPLSSYYICQWQEVFLCLWPPSKQDQLNYLVYKQPRTAHSKCSMCVELFLCGRPREGVAASTRTITAGVWVLTASIAGRKQPG